ncbi:Organic hydroperoxide resistance transcriptional regulator [compost metagenome]
MLTRNRSREDERVVIVQLTEQGHALREQAKHIPRCILEASGQSLEHLQRLQAELVDLRSHLREHL